METMRKFGWYWYITKKADMLESDKCGKWMHFFNNQDFAKEICEKAIKENICWECKCTDLETTGNSTGVICFYLNADDIQHHKLIIEFMMKNELIRKTKTGKYYNESFKFDDQTRAGEYGVDFQGKIKLEEFIDLSTGTWIKE